MTNYERLLREMTVEKLTKLLVGKSDFCTGVYMDLEDEDADCTAPLDMICDGCIRSWLEAKAEQEGNL